MGKTRFSGGPQTMRTKNCIASPDLLPHVTNAPLCVCSKKHTQRPGESVIEDLQSILDCAELIQEALAVERFRKLVPFGQAFGQTFWSAVRPRKRFSTVVLEISRCGRFLFAASVWVCPTTCASRARVVCRPGVGGFGREISRAIKYYASLLDPTVIFGGLLWLQGSWLGVCGLFWLIGVF